jgi:hypothetical protein
LPTKIRIKIGVVEFEYEGDAQFTQDSISELLTHMESLFSASAKELSKALGESFDTEKSPSDNSPTSPIPQQHMNTVAAKLNAKTGPELAMAAAAQLQIIQGNQSFHRDKLLAEMKTATNYYNQNMSGNLSKMLKTLTTSQKFTQVATDTYSLTANEIKIMSPKLA